MGSSGTSGTGGGPGGADSGVDDAGTGTAGETDGEGEDDDGTPDDDGPQTGDFCEHDLALFGGRFSDDDGAGPRIDDVSVRGIAYEVPAGGFTQADYRAMLANDHLIPMVGNLHRTARDHFQADLEDPGKAWPEAAHVLLRYIQANGRVSEVFSNDAVSAEGMNYHFLWLAGMQALAASLHGYVDPVDWTPPPGVKRISVPLTHADIMPPNGRWDRYITNAVKLTLPDATDCGAHDTGLEHHDGSVATQASAWGAGGVHVGHKIDKRAKSYLLPGFGQLGLGEGDLDPSGPQTQSILHFSPKDNGHTHNDTLMFGLFGNGRNLLSFPGHQNQFHGPHNKNLVVVDSGGQNEYVSDLGGRLELFAPLPGVQVARVDGSHIVHGGNANGTGSTEIELYRRTIVQNTVNREKSYTLDIFEVRGGGEHDFLMRGSGVLPQAAPTTDLPTFPGVMPFDTDARISFSETTVSSYGPDDSFWVDFVFEDDARRGSRSHFPPQGEAGELYLNRMEEPWTFESFGLGALVPQYTLHREGENLSSTFVAVHEVLDGSGNSFIESVTRDSIGEDAVAVTVTLDDGRIDVYLVSFDGPQQMGAAGFDADAVVAVSSTLDARRDLWVVDGRSARHGDRSVVANVEPGITGNLDDVFRELDGAPGNFLDTDLDVPFGYALKGQVLLLEHLDARGEVQFVNSFVIEYVEDACGSTRVHVENDPGLVASENGLRERFYPRRPESRWRQNDVAATRVRVVSSATTVPRLARVSPGASASARLDAREGWGLEPGTGVLYSTDPPDASVTYRTATGGEELDATGGAIPVTEHSTLAISVRNEAGFVQAPPVEERYFSRSPALDGTLRDPGLWAEKWSGYTYNFDLDDPLNSYDFARWSEENKVVSTLSFEQVDYETHGAGSGVRVSGYVEVPTTGMYRFFSRMDGAVQLALDDVVILREQGMRRAPEWTAEVYLDAGPHRIEVMQFAFKQAHFSLRWEGPGIPVGDLPEAALFQSIQ